MDFDEERDMQFGIFSVGDITPDPTTGRAPTEHERIKALVTMASTPSRWAWTSSRSVSTTTPRSCRPP